MFDIYASITTFKISWLRRIYVTEGGKQTLKIYPELEHIQKFGIDYAMKFLKESSNLFWKDVIKHYVTLSRKDSIKSQINYAEQPIHFNPMIKRDKKYVYLREWVENDIYKIKDILLADNVLMDYRTFKLNYPNTITTNFLTYQGIVNSILAFKRTLNVNRQETDAKQTKNIWSIILDGNKEVKAALTVTQNLPTAALKWNISFIDLNWELIFNKCFKITKDTKLQWFQTRTLHRILPTNRYLKTCKIIDNHNCTFCINDIETVEHLLWECMYIQIFWKELIALLKSKCTHCDRFFFTEQLVIFGVEQRVRLDNAIDFIILYAKFFIYKCKLEKIVPQCKNFIKALKTRLKIEKYNAIVQNKLNTFQANWLPYKYIFE